MTNIRVFLVEDQEETRDFLMKLFQSEEGISLQGVFADGESFLQSDGVKPNDTVILDIGLPGINGIQTMVRLHQKCPEARCLMFTVFEDDDHLFEAIKAGAEGYILKKDNVKKIIRAVFELNEGGAPMSRSIARRVLEHFRPPKASKPPEDILSSREREVIELLAKGLLYKEVADQLYISEGTVKQHVNHIYTKLHVQNRTEAINKYSGRM